MCQRKHWVPERADRKGVGGKATKAHGLHLNISFEKLSVSELE